MLRIWKTAMGLLTLLAATGCGTHEDAPARPDISNGGALVQIKGEALLHFENQSLCALTDESAEGKSLKAGFDTATKEKRELNIEIANADPAQNGALSTEAFYPSAILEDGLVNFENCRANYRVSDHRVSILGYCKVARTMSPTGEVHDEGSAAIEVVCRRAE